jgi:hypothetical protein
VSGDVRRLTTVDTVDVVDTVDRCSSLFWSVSSPSVSPSVSSPSLCFSLLLPLTCGFTSWKQRWTTSDHHGRWYHQRPLPLCWSQCRFRCRFRCGRRSSRYSRTPVPILSYSCPVPLVRSHDIPEERQTDCGCSSQATLPCAFLHLR